jgi:acetyl esterase/lipase
VLPETNPSLHYMSRMSLLLRIAIVCFSVYCTITSHAAEKDLPTPDQVLKIWDGPAPGVAENPGPEKDEPNGRVSNVSVPTLDVYLPDPKRATGTAIIICSGGGYARLASRPHGQYAAQKFLPLGIAVFSLKYRLKPPSTQPVIDARADGERAMRLVRSRAKEWNLDPARIGMLGWSAGAGVTLNVALNYDAGDPKATDAVEKISSRPDFVVLFCTYGKLQDKALKEGHVLPPAFVNHAKDDTTVPFAASEKIAALWTKAGRPVQLELYDKGGHIGFNWPNEQSKIWPDKFLAWLGEQKLYTPLAIKP